MGRFPGSGGEECPYLRPGLATGQGAPGAAVYCGLPGGRARIPSRDEFERFCAAGHYHDCPGYRRARLRETIVTGLA